MADSIISLRINKETFEKMRMHDEINWSDFLRNCLNQNLEKMNFVNKDKMKKAEKIMKEIRNLEKTKGGKTGTEIIREWRNKQK
jgi:hypothetical protein